MLHFCCTVLHIFAVCRRHIVTLRQVHNCDRRSHDFGALLQEVDLCGSTVIGLQGGV